METKLYSFDNSDSENQSGEAKVIKKSFKKPFLMLLIVIISISSGFGGGIAAIYFGSSILAEEYFDYPITINTNDNINTAEAIAEKVIPSVVGISTKSEVTYQSWFGSQTGISEGSGTGIIVDSQGYILTNSHVVNDGQTQQLKVQLFDGRELDGTILWNDKSIDLAIVKINAENLTSAELGNSEDVKVGSYAVAIGNPLGMAFERSVTQGIISGLNRSITISDGNNQTLMEGLMQTDASINSGNSGGPLLDSKGLVIGINSAKAQSAEGLGFAIPINIAKPIIDEIKLKGEFKRSYMGIKGVSISDYNSAYPYAALNTDFGIYIFQIYTNSPASKAGLKEGDVIIELNNNKVETMGQLIKGLFEHRPGDKVLIKLLRDGDLIELEVVLEEMPE